VGAVALVEGNIDLTVCSEAVCEYTLPEFPSIRIALLRPDGVPIKERRAIVLTPMRAAHVRSVAFTDGNGVVSFTCSDAGPFRVEVLETDEVNARTEAALGFVLPGPSLKVIHLDEIASSGSQVFGQLRSGSLRELGGTIVEAFRTNRQNDVPLRWAHVTPEGMFEFYNLEVGETRLQLLIPGEPPRVLGDQNIGAQRTADLGIIGID